ncbi:RdgB/HAM1 family non-canonical purine NTP pyrophosphatase [bacterium]|nr:RdgB/HAM1 family non-canonical purine NTP pyrophosphatase [bacterium]
MRIVVASDNGHKVSEIQTILSGCEVVSFSHEYGHRHSALEDGDTFASNAIKKLAAWPIRSGVILLADDSGLEVDGLQGAPGVHSARYAGPQATGTDMCRKILDELADNHDRRARFRCVIALRFPDQSIVTVDGCVDGTITREIRGDDGFGYDPIFIPEGHHRTFAEMGPEEKNSLSHRSRALAKARTHIEQFCRSL